MKKIIRIIKKEYFFYRLKQVQNLDKDKEIKKWVGKIIQT